MQNNHSQFIENLSSKARSARWEMFFDKESDSLFWTKRPFPLNDRLAKIAKEISLFLDKSGQINGIMIQPFQSNFLSHNEEVAGFSKLFTKKLDDGVFAISSKKSKEAEPFLATLSATIKKDIYKDAAEAKYPLQNLEKFLVSSSS